MGETRSVIVCHRVWTLQTMHARAVLCAFADIYWRLIPLYPCIAKHTNIDSLKDTHTHIHTQAYTQIHTYTGLHTKHTHTHTLHSIHHTPHITHPTHT